MQDVPSNTDEGDRIAKSRDTGPTNQNPNEISMMRTSLQLVEPSNYKPIQQVNVQLKDVRDCELAADSRSKKSINLGCIYGIATGTIKPVGLNGTRTPSLPHSQRHTELGMIASRHSAEKTSEKTRKALNEPTTTS